MTNITFLLFFVIVPIQEVVPSPLDAARERLVGNGRLEWVYTKTRATLGGLKCEDKLRYAFQNKDAVLVIQCRNGVLASEMKTWSLSEAEDGDILITIDGVTYVLVVGPEKKEVSLRIRRIHRSQNTLDIRFVCRERY